MAPSGPRRSNSLLTRVLARVHDASGIDFSSRTPALRLRPDGLSTEGRVYYTGPRATRQASRVKLDISANEAVIRPPVLREIAHPYPDGPLGGRVRCYSFEELFAEKIRAMAQRARPRDLYDIVNLFRRNDLRLYPELIREALEEKCAAKGITEPTAADFVDSPLIIARRRLGPDARPPTPCPSATHKASSTSFPPVRLVGRHRRVRSSPATTGRVRRRAGVVATSHRRHLGRRDTAGDRALRRHEPPLRRASLRSGRWRLIEPYSLPPQQRRTTPPTPSDHGNGHRTYGVDKIAGLRVTRLCSFRPRYLFQFSSQGLLHALSLEPLNLDWGLSI